MSLCLCCIKLRELSPREGNLCYPVSCTAAAYCQERIGERAGCDMKKESRKIITLQR